jgi:hypothetical protein
MSKDNRTHAQYAKIAAFINYLNLKLDVSGLPVDLTSTERNTFRDIAVRKFFLAKLWSLDGQKG